LPGTDAYTFAASAVTVPQKVLCNKGRSFPCAISLHDKPAYKYRNKNTNENCNPLREVCEKSPVNCSKVSLWISRLLDVPTSIEDGPINCRLSMENDDNVLFEGDRLKIYEKPAHVA
jgi:hypothetical protein